MNEVITFICNNKNFALKINNVVKVEQIKELGNKDIHNYIIGSINFKNNLLPVIDLSNYISNNNQSNNSNLYLISNDDFGNQVAFKIDTLDKTVIANENEFKDFYIDGQKNNNFKLLNANDKKYYVLNINEFIKKELSITKID